MIDIFKHLLPRGRAWSITVDKQLRQFFAALVEPLIDDVKEQNDTVWAGIDPQETTDLKRWEHQFGLTDTAGLSAQGRRDRLEAAWAASGGQSPSYIQEALQGAGFNVYVHDWWVPGTEPSVGVVGTATARNPLTYLKRTYPGDTSPSGYPLVNLISVTTKNYVNDAGESWMEAGEPLAVAGNFLGFIESQKSYTIPSNSDYWPYFLYVGGETFGTLASVPTTRQRELETLCLKLCPAQLWIGMLINYT